MKNVGRTKMERKAWYVNGNVVNKERAIQLLQTSASRQYLHHRGFEHHRSSVIKGLLNAGQVLEGGAS